MTKGRTVVVTGTDTGVGKTYVTAALLGVLKRRGFEAAGVKPVETGCGESRSPEEDGVILAAASGQVAPAHALDRLREPVAPPVAAAREGRSLRIDPWCEAIEGLAARHEVVLVEGAGGLLSPLTGEHTALDLALRLGAPVLVVAADRLGAVNHTLLTLRTLAGATVRSLGVVLSAPAEADSATGRNTGMIEAFARTERVVELPRAAGAGPAGPAMDTVVSWVLP